MAMTPWESSEETAELVGALARALQDMPTVKKNRTAETGKFSYSYADLASIIETVRPTLKQQGLAIVQSAVGAGEVQTTVLHSSGQWLSFPPLSMPPTQGTPQAVGSALSFARRYSLLALLGLAPDDDDDGTAASKAPADAPPPPTHPGPRGGKAITEKQKQVLGIRLRANGYGDRQAGLDFIAEHAGRRVESSKDLTAAEASKVLDALPDNREQPTLDEPPPPPEPEEEF